jgi:hypothetical protein
VITLAPLLGGMSAAARVGRLPIWAWENPPDEPAIERELDEHCAAADHWTRRDTSISRGMAMKSTSMTQTSQAERRDSCGGSPQTWPITSRWWMKDRSGNQKQC